MAGNASANILLDFNGVQGQVNDYYNGGTDSAGNTGVNYGIHFDSGSVVNGVLAGGATLTFAPTHEVRGLTFQATRWDTDGNYSWLYGDYLDAVWIGGTANPHCTNLTPQQCIDAGWGYIPPNRLFDYSTGVVDNLYKIVFTTNLLDNLAFISDIWNAPAGEPSTGTVPEPSSIALLGLGALGLIGARRRQSAKSQNA